MADPTEDDIPESTTWGAHMRAIRREQHMLLQTQSRIVEMLGRIQTQLSNVQSDVTLLENHNISRHGDVLNILERLDRANIPQIGRSYRGDPASPVGRGSTGAEPPQG